MKHYITLISLILLPIAGFSQLKVHQNGNISIGTSGNILPLSTLTLIGNGNSAYNLYIDDSKSGIFSRTLGSDDTWQYGANMSSIVGDSKTFFVGVRGDAVSADGTDYNKGRAFGVMGTAGGATSGWNYGVFGRLCGQGNGAAICGTTENLDNGIELKDRYAGYFHGKVSVRGDLTVRGFIDGMLLCPSLDEYVLLSPIGKVFSTFNTNVSENQPAISETLSSLSAVVGTGSFDSGWFHPNDTFPLTSVNNTTLMERQYAQKSHYGLPVEDVESVYPDLVYKTESGEKAINYIEMIPLLVESIKELRTYITELRTEIMLLQSRYSNSTMKLASYDNSSNVNTADIPQTIIEEVPSLSNNVPNPFSSVTSVKMVVPSSAKNALLCIYDMSGKQIRQNIIADRGEVTFSVTSDGLGAGMYLYSLIIDGKLIETRRMIITQ